MKLHTFHKQTNKRTPKKKAYAHASTSQGTNHTHTYAQYLIIDKTENRKQQIKLNTVKLLMWVSHLGKKKSIEALKRIKWGEKSSMQ